MPIGTFGSPLMNPEPSPGQIAMGPSLGSKGVGQLSRVVLGHANPNAARAQRNELELQDQTLSQRKRLFDLLLGTFSRSGGQNQGVQNLVDQIGQAYAGQTANINQQYADLTNSTMARFAQYGMGGSSGVPSVLAGIERQKALALGELNDQKIMNQVGVQERALDRAMQMQSILAGLL